MATIAGMEAGLMTRARSYAWVALSSSPMSSERLPVGGLATILATRNWWRRHTKLQPDSFVELGESMRRLVLGQGWTGRVAMAIGLGASLELVVGMNSGGRGGLGGHGGLV